MKIVFMGTTAFSVTILKALHERYDVSLVVTQPDTPQGRKRHLTPPPVKIFATEANIPVFQPENIKNDYHVILAAKPDFIVTAAYGQIIPKAVLDTPVYEALNVHASFLPKLRGGAPIQRAIEHRHDMTGVSIIRMHRKMDAGAIFSQHAIAIEPDETALSLFEKLAPIGRDLLMETIPKIMHENITPVPQIENEVTYAPNIKREEEWLDFKASVYTLDAKVRAFYAQPNTYTTVDGKRLKVIKARVHTCDNFDEKHRDTPPGTILKHFDDGVGVKCADGALVLTEIQLSGKRAMPALDFIRGAGRNLVKIGEILGR